MIAATTGLGIRATVVKDVWSGAGALDHVRVGHVVHLLDVRAGGEDPLAAVDDHGLDVVTVGGLGRGSADLLLHLHVQGVHLGPVEPDRAHALADLQAAELGHADTPHGRGGNAPDCSGNLAPGRRGAARWPRSSLHLALAGPGETAPVWPGAHQQLGATWTPTATNFATLLGRGHRPVGLPLRRPPQRDAPPAHRRTPSACGTGGSRTCRSASGTLPRRRSRGPRRTAPVQPPPAAPRPLRPRHRRRPRPGPAARRRQRRRTGATPRRPCPAASWCTTSSTGATTSRCGPGGATRSSTS